jgi:CRP-like cAMP-binding protein
LSDQPNIVLAPLLHKLSLWTELDADDQAAVLALPYLERPMEAGHYIVSEGDRPQRSCLLLSGFAYRQKVAGDGGRQILSHHMDGNLVDLQNSLRGIADHSVQMLTAGRVVASHAARRCVDARHRP